MESVELNFDILLCSESRTNHRQSVPRRGSRARWDRRRRLRHTAAGGRAEAAGSDLLSCKSSCLKNNTQIRT